VVTHGACDPSTASARGPDDPTPDGPFCRGTPPARPHRKRIALIDDSKENAQELLGELVAVLHQRFGVAEVVSHRKPSASKPAAPETIAELAQTCDYAIVAIGS